jgi:predicted GNAT superfamily acetyltransferase
MRPVSRAPARPGAPERAKVLVDCPAVTDDAIRIRAASSRADLETCVNLQRAVWGLADLEINSALHLTASLHAGGLLHLAETAAGEAVAFAYAFPAIRGGVAQLHSDMLAVLPGYQERGIGGRLKWAQRDDALAAGVSLMTWTFDPLQARNANLNLRRLGATAMEFLENFYGVTSSALHHDLPTDRLLVYWNLRSPRVEALAARREPNLPSPLPDLPRVNEVKWQAGWPVSSDPILDLDAPEALLEIPPDWNVLARSAPRVAEAWQARIRRAFQGYFARGYVAADFALTEERGRRRPFYVLRKKKG